MQNGARVRAWIVASLLGGVIYILLIGVSKKNHPLNSNVATQVDFAQEEIGGKCGL